MFSKFFQKPSESQRHPPSPQQNDVALSDWAPRVSVHYGIPSTASVLAFDPIQRLLAIGTLDGRIKVIGGDNIEGLLTSPKALPFKNLEFLQNQGFLVSVSNENEIQVWDLDRRRISSNLQWESNITAFSVIFGTQFMYVGDEYGFLSVLKYDAEEGNILPLPYHIPPNLIAEGAGISMPDQLSIVGVLAQPSSRGNRVLIAYENGFIVLWDITEDRPVHVKGYGHLQLKEGIVLHFSNNKSQSQSQTYMNDSLDDEDVEKEISSLCWISPDGSVLAVGYVDGDILLWNLSVSENGTGQGTDKSPNDVVKIQLSSGNKRLPVIILHWSSNKALNGRGGQLFAYGGEHIGSEEVLTILDLDWSSGLAKLKCVERTDLALHGSFADLIVISNAYEGEKSNMTSLFVLTNPGQLHFYEYDSLSIFNSRKGQNHSMGAVQYQSVIPTVEPYMTVGKLHILAAESISLGALPETVFPLKLQSDIMLTERSTKWPLTGGVPSRMSSTENNRMERLYIGGYQDGSVRIWDATYPVLSLVSVLGFEIEGTQVVGASASVSVLDFSSACQILAIGNECGVILLYKLQGNSNKITVTVSAETKHEVHHFPQEAQNRCYAIYSILKSPVRALKFASCGVRLVAGFESGQVAMLDTSSLSVLFVTDSVSSSKSSMISLEVEKFADSNEKSDNCSESRTGSESAKEIVFVLTRDAELVLMDSTSGNLICSQPICPKENLVAVNMNILEGKHPLEESRKAPIVSSQLTEAQVQPLPTSSEDPGVVSSVEDATQPDLECKSLPSQILVCCEDALYLYSLESMIQGNSNPLHELKFEKPCSWSTILKRNAEEYAYVLVYQSGDIEMRSLPDLEVLGKASMMSILRWNFKNNMNRTMSASEKGLITLVHGSEFAFVSLTASENEFRIPESLPCLHDEVLAAAAGLDVNYTDNQNKTQSTRPGFVSNMIKGLKGDKVEQDLKGREPRENLMAHLDGIFSRFPFSDPTNAFDLEDMELQLDDIDVDEPVNIEVSSQKGSDNIKGKEAERERLFEGGSSDTKPKARTREEIIVKYKYKGDAAAAASEAKNKLLERQEKLEKLSERTEELQNGAQDFASMAQELAKQMEKRKWWNI